MDRQSRAGSGSVTATDEPGGFDDEAHLRDRKCRPAPLDECLKDPSQPILKYVVAGWQISGVTIIQSGTPVNATLSTDRANIGITGVHV